MVVKTDTLERIADLEIPPILRRKLGEKPAPIPEDAPSLSAINFNAYRAPVVNSRGETPGERSKRRRDKDRAYGFVMNVLKHARANETMATPDSAWMTIGQLVKATESAHPSDPIPQHALKSALGRLIKEKLVVQDGRWYSWR